MPDDKPHDAATDPAAMPSDNGVAASVDPKTGEVRGSGIGAGGGSVGEDFSSDPETGDGTPFNGIDPETPEQAPGCSDSLEI